MYYNLKLYQNCKILKKLRAYQQDLHNVDFTFKMCYTILVNPINILPTTTLKGETL